jgi:hypothetical protein
MCRQLIYSSSLCNHESREETPCHNGLQACANSGTIEEVDIESNTFCWRCIDIAGFPTREQERQIDNSIGDPSDAEWTLSAAVLLRAFRISTANRLRGGGLVTCFEGSILETDLAWLQYMVSIGESKLNDIGLDAITEADLEWLRIGKPALLLGEVIETLDHQLAVLKSYQRLLLAELQLAVETCLKRSMHKLPPFLHAVVDINSLPEDDRECTICLVPYYAQQDEGVPAESPARLTCAGKHVFGQMCLKNSFANELRQGKCPVCRTAINLAGRHAGYVAGTIASPVWMAELKGLEVVEEEEEEL